MRPPTSVRSAKLARQILDVALDSGLQTGDRLTETGLATACNVSRTPIRTALSLLEQQGIARRMPEGGFVLARDPASAPAGDTAPNGGLIQRIVRDRTSRRLGQSVTIADLVRRYDISRAAAQNALETLSASGMLSRAEGQSWLFSPLPGDRAAHADSYAFRMALEPQALLVEGFQIDPKRAARVREQTAGLLTRDTHGVSPTAFQDADQAFHMLIARSCPNPFIAGSLGSHHHLRHLSGPPPGISAFRIQQALQEHLRILDTAEQGLYDVAADLMRAHLRLSGTRRPGVANRGAPAAILARTV